MAKKNSIGAHTEKTDEKDIVDNSSDGPDEGPTMSVTGAMPAGSEMAHWNTSQSSADATEPGSMPKTKSTPMPGEKDHASRNQV